ncbi:hypothetical protein [Pseudomonas yamanorum]|uniref:hypothetical protein n=1 Tax=Pseudomonas yamanorum TaxID=515393 RepID=UPI003D365624
MDDHDSGKRNCQVGNALSLAADEVELWVEAIEEDGSGMGYVCIFQSAHPPKCLPRSLGSSLIVRSISAQSTDMSAPR